MKMLRRLWYFLWFVVFFTWEFLRANWQVLQEVLRIRRTIEPALIEVPLRSRTALEIVSIANLTTLTPGTLTIEVAEDPPMLYVHGMFAGDPEAFAATVHRVENRLLAWMRPADSELERG